MVLAKCIVVLAHIRVDLHLILCDCVEQGQNLQLEIEKAREQFKNLLNEHVLVSAVPAQC